MGKTQKRRREHRLQKRKTANHFHKNGGGFFDGLFGKKETPFDDKKFEPIVKGQPNPPEKPKQKKLMNYNVVNIKYNENPILCDVCKEKEFYSMDMSIERSKTSTVAVNFLTDEQNNNLISHPVKSYVCTNCSNCRFVYASTFWNKVEKKIVETEVKK